MSDVAFRSAVDLTAAIRKKEIGSRELLDLYLDRIERLNGPINAIVTMDVDGARTAADAADDALAHGEVAGPLHGLPMTVKDNMSVAGMRSTAGANILKDYVPEEDGLVAQWLREAGAIIFGKTNMPAFGMDAQTYNDIFGVTCNPWDTTRTPGGSSGGAAAALAAGLTGLEVGTDIGGSIRSPAHYCGVYGHKPTYGLVPRRGHLGMPGARSFTDISVIGPMGRSAGDLALGMDVLAGADPLDNGVGWTLTLPPSRHTNMKAYRVAAWLDDESYPVEKSALAVLEHAVAALEDAGVHVDRTARPAFTGPEAYDSYLQMLIGTISPGRSAEEIQAILKGEAPIDENNKYQTLMARHLAQTHRDWMLGNEQREQLRARWYEFFQDFDILLCPVASVPAFPHNIDEVDQTLRTIAVNGQEVPYLDVIFWAGLTCGFHLPAVSAPVGLTTDGLPVGLQIVGPYLEDRTPLAFAVHVEEVVGGFAPPPGY